MSKRLLGRMVAFQDVNKKINLGMIVDVIEHPAKDKELYTVEWYGAFGAIGLINYPRLMIKHFLEEYNCYKRNIG